MSPDQGARDALALIACELRADQAGAAVILGTCDLRQVAALLVLLATECIRHVSGASDEALAAMVSELLLRLAGEDSS